MANSKIVLILGRKEGGGGDPQQRTQLTRQRRDEVRRHNPDMIQFATMSCCEFFSL